MNLNGKQFFFITALRISMRRRLQKGVEDDDSGVHTHCTIVGAYCYLTKIASTAILYKLKCTGWAYKTYKNLQVTDSERQH